MVEFGDQQHHAARGGVVVECPVQAERRRDGGKTFAHGGDAGRAEQVEANAGKKFAGFGIVKLLRLADIGTMLEQIGGDGSDNAGAVLAREGQHILRLGHEIP